MIACLSWPCFLESSKTCSLSKLQSPESLLIVTTAMRIRDVDARSDAFGFVSSVKMVELCHAHLSCLLLQRCELLDSCLNVFLFQSARYKSCCITSLRTWASCSASGICLSTSFEKSLSGLRIWPSDMMAKVKMEVSADRFGNLSTD